MQSVTDLIDAARRALNVSSDAEFARHLGVSRGTIANWKSGYSLPDTVMCATLAGLTGLPLAQVLGIVGEARAISREEKAVWRKLAATAMALCLAVGSALPHDVQAMPQAGGALHDIHYAKEVSGDRGLRWSLLPPIGWFVYPSDVPPPSLLAQILRFPGHHEAEHRVAVSLLRFGRPFDARGRAALRVLRSAAGLVN
ncbi:DUF3693 domain-containing protein [Stenotrophomonas maltophilia]|uniref:DUF3693 domain-containing protein n=1 Tax=Stenotrophomonas maltophilia TaxID=40324 RepID=UPI0015EC404A